MQLHKLSRKSGSDILIVMWLCTCTPWVMAKEFPNYQLTGVEGYVGLGYRNDELTREPAKDRYTLETQEQEVYLLTHSYVYHPNLLEIDFGGGFATTQNKLESSSPPVEREYDDELYSLTARLRFLKQKPYPVTLFYDRTNPTTNTSTTERFVRENERFGVNASLLEPLLPFSVNLRASRQTNQGTGVTQIIDERNDDVFLRAYRAIGDDGHGQLTYHTIRRVAENGFTTDPGPIKRTDIRSESTSFDTHFRFGVNRQYTLTNLISYYEQDNYPVQKEFRFNPSLTWQHSARSASYYRFDYLQSEIDVVETENTSGSIGGRHQFAETVAGNAELHSDRTTTTGLKNTTNGVNGTLSYTKPLSFGQLQLSVGSRYAITEREASADDARRENEPVRLNGVQNTALQNPNVINVETVILEDNPGEILQKDEDYIVEYHPGHPDPDSKGITYIRRVTGGKIESGQIVLVDYTYQTGGSVVFSSFNQNYNARLELFKYYSIYLNYSDTDNQLEEGTSDIPLNSTRTLRYGSRIDHPFMYDRLRLGGEVIHEEQKNELSPYDRNSLETFFQVTFFSDMTLRLTDRRVQQENHLSDEDIDLRSQSARLSTHPFPRSTLSMEVSQEKDTGGTQVRRFTQKSIMLQWRIRKLFISVDGRSIEESQGSNEQRHNVISAKLRREF